MRLGPLTLTVILALTTTLPLAGQDPAAARVDLKWTKVTKPEFLSVVRDDAGEISELRTSVVRFVPYAESSEIDYVDLIGAVHIGDASYYETLNRVMSDYDVVLFELAHDEDPRGHLDSRPDSQPSFLKMLQMNPASAMGLEHQLERIDYDRDHFVHADTSLQTAMDRRGDDWMTLLASVFMDLMRQGRDGLFDEGALDDGAFDPLSLFGFGSSDPQALKRTMAAQLAAQGIDGLPGFTTLNDVLIGERNKVAMERLAEQLTLGRKRIAIFYGAAHMRDFTQRLVVEHQLRPDRIAWLTAWDMHPGRGQAARRTANPLADALGGEVDRDSIHGLVDQLLDVIEQLSRELEQELEPRPAPGPTPAPSPTPRRRRHL